VSGVSVCARLFLSKSGLLGAGFPSETLFSDQAASLKYDPSFHNWPLSALIPDLSWHPIKYQHLVFTLILTDMRFDISSPIFLVESQHIGLILSPTGKLFGKVIAQVDIGSFLDPMSTPMRCGGQSSGYALADSTLLVPNSDFIGLQGSICTGGEPDTNDFLKSCSPSLQWRARGFV
jgi:hypothetical protein